MNKKSRKRSNGTLDLIVIDSIPLLTIQFSLKVFAVLLRNLKSYEFFTTFKMELNQMTQLKLRQKENSEFLILPSSRLLHWSHKIKLLIKNEWKLKKVPEFALYRASEV